MRFFLREPAGTTTLERQGNQSADPVDDFHGAGLVQHQQPGLDAANQRRDTIEPLRVTSRCEALAERFLDSCEIDNALTHHRFGNLPVISVFLLRQLRFVFALHRYLGDDQVNLLLIKPVFDFQKRRGNFDDRLFIGRPGFRNHIS